ncbi:spindle and centriole-associated protein 1 isoform X1 [Nothobranchius furzeri]|uniref:spindle and centriole-associated protein 1 isoform X1 n=1 Tax=Nothobranchius furzeri TaxID=105023 RepID=UPI0039048357
MSLARGSRPQPQGKGKKPVRQKKAPKKDWVSTVHDLSVHKLTPAELSHRHEIHKSHNKAVAQWELKERALKRRFRHAGSPAPLDQASLSIIKEVFSDQLLLQDVLARSDRAMAVVKDLFGDAPQRQTGHPSVTVAPNCDSDLELPVLQRLDSPMQLSLLSQSMMDQEALNEVDVSREDWSSGSRAIRRSNIRQKTTQGRVVPQRKVHRLRNPEDDDDVAPMTPCTSGRAPDQTALNATVAVRRVWSKHSQSDGGGEEASARVSQVLNPDPTSHQPAGIGSYADRTRKCLSQSSKLDGSSPASLSGDQSSLGLLQAMLGQVEADLDALSPDLVPESESSSKHHKTQGLTGFSVALVGTLGRLVHLLKQLRWFTCHVSQTHDQEASSSNADTIIREAEAQKEAEGRRRVEEELKEQRGLIDALTAEIMTLREEAAALQAGLQQRTAELEHKLDSVVLVMGGLGLLGEHTPHKDSDARDALSNVCPSASVAERAPEETRVKVPPAIVLSPPTPSHNWQHSHATHPAPLQQHLPPLDSQRSQEVVQAHGSASSLHSVALSHLSSSSSSPSLSLAPLITQPSPEAMLAEIAQLSRQAELMRSQLNQAKGLGPGIAGLPNSNSSQQGGRSPDSIPQDVGERRASGSSRNQNIQSLDETSSQQSSTSHTPSVEQRLLELNRQSAAARSRLLELIELQKQNVSIRVSPSVSPVLSSVFSPNTAAESGSLEESVLRPGRDVQTQQRSAGSDESPRSFETRNEKSQPQKQRGREGWFSLSAHTR